MRNYYNRYVAGSYRLGGSGHSNLRPQRRLGAALQTRLLEHAKRCRAHCLPATQSQLHYPGAGSVEPREEGLSAAPQQTTEPCSHGPAQGLQARSEHVWDDELAEVAQALADQCGDMMHDRADARFTRRFRLTGQNLASERRSNDVRKIGSLGFVDTWFKEHRDYPPYQVKHFEPSFGPRPTGHFTQVIWADTRYLGCGFTMFRMKGDLSVMPYQKHYVCNYADSGNIKGRPVYAEGPTCSRCPAGSRCVKRTGLCRARKRSRRGRQRSVLSVRGSGAVRSVLRKSVTSAGRGDSLRGNHVSRWE
nr:glioma pathogenesis-related protein 1-like isoform X4 [Dermacentor andersoni]